MSKLVKRPQPRRKLKGKPTGFLLVILLWSLAMGWLLAIATNVQGTTPPAAQIGTVDVVPAQFQLGQQLYLENCSTCHIALPPAILPTQTWKNLLEDSQHYGTQLKPLVDPPRTLVWRYLSTFSRLKIEDEEIPYRIDKSRLFKALHPKVKLPRPVTMDSCVTCHAGASKYNFRSLTSEWE
ncbi:MAG: cytochrome C [Calothrix sp. SM1_7_51]|nr:cytochrome C [Calothrix sp. SM1_7_51]